MRAALAFLMHEVSRLQSVDRFFVHNWHRVSIHFLRKMPKFMDEPNRHIAQLWHPALYKNPIWILIEALFGRIINTDRIDPYCIRLHLRLCVVDTRLIIGELARRTGSQAARLTFKRR